jgi:hypothetical protein
MPTSGAGGTRAAVSVADGAALAAGRADARPSARLHGRAPCPRQRRGCRTPDFPGRCGTRLAFGVTRCLSVREADTHEYPFLIRMTSLPPDSGYRRGDNNVPAWQD